MEFAFDSGIKFQVLCAVIKYTSNEIISFLVTGYGYHLSDALGIGDRLIN